MEISTRAQAHAEGSKKYFTGEVCRNGHIAERYTQSATCVECLRASQAAMRSSYDATRTPERAVGNAYLSSLVSVRCRFVLASLEGISTIMEAAAAMRYPLLAGKGARLFKGPRLSHRTAGTAIGQFLVHPDDEGMLLALCNHSIHEMTSKNVVVPPMLSPAQLLELENERFRTSERSHPPADEVHP